MSALKKTKTRFLPHKKTILTDIDGVLLEFLPSLNQFLREEKNIHISLEQWQKSYWLHDHIGGTEQMSRRVFIEFSHSRYFREIPAKKCALDVIAKLKDDGWRFIGITAAGQDNPEQDLGLVKRNRLDNLEHHFGNVFEDLFITQHNQCKSDHLKYYEPTWWIEDSVNNAHIGHAHGHNAIIMKSMYYREEDNKENLPVAESWHCIDRFIKQAS